MWIESSRARLWRLAALTALLSAVAVLVVRAWSPKTQHTPRPVALPQPAAVPKPLAQASVPLPQPDAAPADVPAVEWQRLQAAIGDAPADHDKLMQAAAYLGFRHRVQRWNNMRLASDPLDARQALATQLLAELPTHWQRGELNGAEAQGLWNELRSELGLPEDPSGQALIQAATPAQAQTGADAGAGDAQAQQAAAAQAEDARRLAAFKSGQAQIVQQWMATPTAQRDPKALQAQLDALRRQSFDSPPPAQTRRAASTPPTPPDSAGPPMPPP